MKTTGHFCWFVSHPRGLMGSEEEEAIYMRDPGVSRKQEKVPLPHLKSQNYN